MRYLMLIFFLVLVSCGPTKEEIDAAESKIKYLSGEVLYIKPDSGKVVVLSGTVYIPSGCGCRSDADTISKYTVRDLKGNILIIPETLIHTEQSLN